MARTELFAALCGTEVVLSRSAGEADRTADRRGWCEVELGNSPEMIGKMKHDLLDHHRRV